LSESPKWACAATPRRLLHDRWARSRFSRR